MFLPFKKAFNHHLFLIAVATDLGKTERGARESKGAVWQSCGEHPQGLWEPQTAAGGSPQRFTKITTLKLRHVGSSKSLNQFCTTDLLV